VTQQPVWIGFLRFALGGTDSQGGYLDHVQRGVGGSVERSRKT
jgi:hypothetical protein